MNATWIKKIGQFGRRARSFRPNAAPRRIRIIVGRPLLLAHHLTNATLADLGAYRLNVGPVQHRAGEMLTGEVGRM